MFRVRFVAVRSIGRSRVQSILGLHIYAMWTTAVSFRSKRLRKKPDQTLEFGMPVLRRQGPGGTSRGSYSPVVDLPSK